ncbi:MAG: hypothetical protein Q9168_003593, partial [Polycauliona sp. 1 TL-2023]
MPSRQPSQIEPRSKSAQSHPRPTSVSTDQPRERNLELLNTNDDTANDPIQLSSKPCPQEYNPAVKMAGHHNNSLAMDPALVKYASKSPLRYTSLPLQKPPKAIRSTALDEALTQWAHRHADEPLQILPVDTKNGLVDGC